ncbi:MAG: hypothetical protein JW818_15310 [Pirellulales bacterium]|nr:hypothetical protein [Pirellulales bacterium]
MLGGDLPEGFQDEFEAAGSADQRDQVVGRWFDVCPIQAAPDVEAEGLYYARDKEPHLVQSQPVASQPDLLAMTFLFSGQRAKPVARRKFFELAAKSGLVRLAPKGTIQGKQDADDEEETGPVDVREEHPESSIDLSTLTQLLTAARQSGLVPAADQIAHVRDCEFRMGKYQRAFDTIERVYVKFTQAATKRQEQLRAEEIRYRAGKLKMSPKQWMQKKQRDNSQTLIIERARRKFAHVLDGLRLLARES